MIRELINVCYSIDSKETLIRETAALLEGMRYFNLRTGKIIIAEGEADTIKKDGHVISIEPFYRWALASTT